MTSWRVREGFGRRWARRALTVPSVVLATALLWVTLPLVLPVAALSDRLRGSRGAATRLVAFGAVYGACETAGLVASAALWIAGPPALGASRERFEARNFRLQCLWAGTLFAAARRLFDLRLEVEDGAKAAPGPLLLFVRHASILDTLLPAVLVSARRGIRLRYVLKRELLLDPCLDVVGQRLPNVFVQRGSGQGEREIRGIRALAAGLGPDEGVLIYPEGTRTSPARRERALARIAAAGDDERLERARGLRHLLPPRRGGPQALLDAAKGADLVLLGHVGLEGLRSVRDVLSGALVGRSLRIRFWRIPAAEIPSAEPERQVWLDREWARLDRWVEAQLGRGAVAAVAPAPAA